MNPLEAAASLGISLKMLRRWDRVGKLAASRAPANTRRKKTLPVLVSKTEQEERAA